MAAARSRGGQRGAWKDGGHRPRVLIGEHWAWLPRRIAGGSDMTLRGLAAELAGQGVKEQSNGLELRSSREDQL